MDAASIYLESEDLESAILLNVSEMSITSERVQGEDRSMSKEKIRRARAGAMYLRVNDVTRIVYR